jgi:hypothetical protein
MRACPDKEFEWIQSGVAKLLSSKDPQWKGNFVSHLVPPKFEAYAKILHRITANYENIDKPLSNREIAILRTPPCTELRSFVDALRSKGEGLRIRWQKIAELLRMPFSSEICHDWFRKRLGDPACWPRFLYGPLEGSMDSEELSEVVSLLRRFTGEQECFLRFAPIPLAYNDGPLLFAGALDEVAGFLKENEYRFSPEYLWPSDRTWCVCTDYDLTFTIVAGRRNLISAVVSSSALEALEVNQQTRIDSLVPIPNLSV